MVSLMQTLGIDSQHIINITCFIIQLLIAEFLFFWHMEKRDHFTWRAMGGGAVFYLLSVAVPAVVMQYLSGVRTFLILMLSLAYIGFCFKRSFVDILFCAIGAFTLQNLGNNLQVIFCGLIGTSFQMVSWEMCAVYAVVYVTGYFTCAKRVQNLPNISGKRLKILAMAAVVLVVCWLLQDRLINAGLDLLVISRAPFAFCCILSLFVQFGFLEQFRMGEENAALEQLLKENEKQYELSRRTVEIINMKCHDLKHRILELESREGADKEQLEEIRQAVGIYDGLAKTGCRPLDIVLSEKNLLCERYRIKFSYMVDGEKLDRLSPGDIAVIFGNALDNAIECARNLPDEEKRIISLIGCARRDVVGIHIENYCETTPVFQDGLPLSTKGDADYHGFGLKSIRHVVEKYGGNLVVNLEDRIFSLDIIIPN